MLIVLLILGIPCALALWLVVRASQAKDQIEELTRRLDSLELGVARMKRERESVRPVEPAPEPPAQTVSPEFAPLKPVAAWRPALPPHIQPVFQEQPSGVAPQAPPVFDAPLVSNQSTSPEPAPAPPVLAQPAINWEQFMGVKGLAWISGFTFFLGIVFAIQYSFGHHLIPPGLQAAFGFLTGLGVLVVGVVMSRRNYAALSQTLCATGVLLLYAVTFACRSYYKFEFFGAIPTFLLMALITVTAFLLALRLNALVVAILGMLGGFLTPILLSTGQDNPLGLFGYIAILDTGLILLALRRRWYFLAALAALGTAMMQIGWAGKFFVADKYFDGNKILVALGVLLGFNVLYLAASWWAKRRPHADGEEPLMIEKASMDIKQWIFGSTVGLAAVALAFTKWFLSFQPLAHRPWLMFGFVFLIDLVVLALVLADETMAVVQAVAGLAVFGLLGWWTQQWLTNELLNASLAFYFIFAVLHSALPAFFQRRRGGKVRAWAVHIFPLLALVLVLVPIFKLAEVSFIVWPFVLLVDLLAIMLAVLTASLWSVLAVLLLTLAATGALIFKIPSDLTGLPISFLLLAAFVIFFVAASIWLVRKFQPGALKAGIQLGGRLDRMGGVGAGAVTAADVAEILPACSVVLPFLLLIMATLRLPLANPSPVFGLALLLVVLLLGVTRLFLLDWMPAIGLACVAALECAWHFNRFDPANINQPLNLVLAWYLVFFAVFAVFPFLFTRSFADKTAPWAAAAMAGPLQFFLIHRFVAAVHPNAFMGLLPAAFAVPGLLSMVVVLKRSRAEAKSRMAQLAWFGGVALFFITLIFPIQFDRQWITIGWALEGAALLWLFHRVPHPGLRLTGLGLLAAAFVRLALNPAVLEYHPRAAMPIFNWYLYAYGLVTIALFAGAKLLAPPRHLVLQSNMQPVLAGLGTVLAFLLLNIEIADYFSAPGSTLTFQFSGNFARDMTYSIAWALFALVLLVAGIAKKIPAARYAAIGLLGVTLLKLFFHDLAQLGQLYRIGAFIGVAVIAMLASFLYQKFFTAGRKEDTKHEAQP
jgi:Predicted membrane protein (DUF2339)